eukprot:1842202-Amphidinium_carterae.1
MAGSPSLWSNILRCPSDPSHSTNLAAAKSVAPLRVSGMANTPLVCESAAARKVTGRSASPAPFRKPKFKPIRGSSSSPCLTAR